MKIHKTKKSVHFWYFVGYFLELQPGGLARGIDFSTSRIPAISWVSGIFSKLDLLFTVVAAHRCLCGSAFPKEKNGIISSC